MQLASVERVRTMAPLQRFFRTALLVGQMPSVLGREIFRQHVRTVPARAFEDSVVFVCDVKRCLRALDPFERRLLRSVFWRIARSGKRRANSIVARARFPAASGKSSISSTRRSAAPTGNRAAHRRRHLSVLYEGLPPEQALAKLFGRSLKPEF